MMAALTMATFPLQSWRMVGLLDICGCGFCFELAVDGDGSWLGAAVVADSATAASFSGVLRRVNAVLVEISGKRELFGWTGFHAQATTFALVGVDVDVTAG